MILALLLQTNIALQLPNHLLQSICWIESNHRNIDNMDDGGSPSYGVCQIKLDTANFMKYRARMDGPELTESDLRTEEINVLYAGLYVKYQLWRYSNDMNKAISAYNAGTYTTKNKAYVEKVLKKIEEYKKEKVKEKQRKELIEDKNEN